MHKTIQIGYDKDFENLAKHIHSNYKACELIDFEDEQRMII